MSNVCEYLEEFDWESIDGMVFIVGDVVDVDFIVWIVLCLLWDVQGVILFEVVVCIQFCYIDVFDGVFVWWFVCGDGFWVYFCGEWFVNVVYVWCVEWMCFELFVQWMVWFGLYILLYVVWMVWSFFGVVN